MPENMTWWNFLPFYQALLEWTRAKLGITWIAKVPIGIGHTMGFLFVALLVILAGFAVHQRTRKTASALIPDGRMTLRNFFELFSEILLGLMEPIMGRPAAIYFLPLIGTVGTIIMISNLLGLIPGFAPPTSNLNTTASMAVVIFFLTHYYGLKTQGIKYFRHFLGPIIKWYALPLMVFMFVIEVISHLTRPVSLSVRLMGNMFADHMLVAMFTLLAPLVVPIPLIAIGLLICVIQALVFCLLSVIYISMAIAPEEH